MISLSSFPDSIPFSTRVLCTFSAQQLLWSELIGGMMWGPICPVQGFDGPHLGEMWSIGADCGH